MVREKGDKGEAGVQVGGQGLEGRKDTGGQEYQGSWDALGSRPDLYQGRPKLASLDQG